MAAILPQPRFKLAIIGTYGERGSRCFYTHVFFFPTLIMPYIQSNDHKRTVPLTVKTMILYIFFQIYFFRT